MKHRQPVGVLGEEALRLGTGVIGRPVLNQDQALAGLPQHALEKGNVNGRVEPPFVPLIEEAPGEVINLLPRQSQNLGPSLVAPCLAFNFIEVIRDKGCFLIIDAEVIEQLGDIEDVVSASVAVG